MSDFRTQLKAFSDLTEKQIKRAAGRALNRAATSTRAEASRRVRDTLNLKAADAKDQIVITKADTSEDLLDMKVTLTVYRKETPLIQFAPNDRVVKTRLGNRFGVSVEVKKDSGRKLVQGGFIVQFANGNVGIFERLPGTTQKDAKQLKELYSTGVYDIWNNNGYLRSLYAYGYGEFKKNFASELSYQLTQVNG